MPGPDRNLAAAAALFVSRIDAVLATAVPPAPTPADRPPHPHDRPPGVLAVERGIAWPALTCDPGSSAAFDLLGPLLDDAVDPESVAAVDRSGHARPAYRGLLGYAMFQAVRASDRVLLGVPAAAADRWLAALSADVRSADRWLPRPGGDDAAADVPARLGGEAVGAAWSALAVHGGGELFHDDRAAAVGRRFLLGPVARQQPAGHFLKPGPRDNLESFWFHELQLLHAVAAFGLQARDADALAAARRSAAYHVAETQPDHATNEPWGLPGFLCDADAVVMADQLMHSAGVQQPGGPGGVTLILLADTLYSLRRYRSG